MKEAVANKKDRHCSTQKNMWFGVLISCIILIGDVFTIHSERVGVD